MITLHDSKSVDDDTEPDFVPYGTVSAQSNSIPVIWFGSQGLIFAALQAALQSSRFRIEACVVGAHEIAVAAAALAPRFLLIIDDACMPRAPGESAQIGCLREAFPEAILAVIVGSRLTADDARCFGHANVIVRYNASPEQLINALNIAMDGVAILPMVLAGTVPPPGRAEPGREVRDAVGAGAIQAEPAEAGTGAQGTGLQRPLSNREVTILQCLSAGQSNKSIARSLSIAESTVKIHIKGILRKISARNRTQAAVWALNNLK